MTGKTIVIDPDQPGEAGYGLAEVLSRESRAAYRRFWLLVISGVAPLLLFAAGCITHVRTSGGDFSDAMGTLTLVSTAASILATCIAMVIHVRLGSHIRVSPLWMKQALRCQQLPAATRQQLEALDQQGITPTLIAAFSMLLGVGHQTAPDLLRGYERMASYSGLSSRADAQL